MDTSTPSTPNPKDRTVPLLVTAAVGAVIFICASAFLVYTNTERLVASRDWRDHSLDVLSTLQSTTQHLDHINLVSRLYIEGKNAEDLQSAELNAVASDAGLVHLEELLRDQSTQLGRARSLHACVQQLMDQVNEQLPRGISPARKILQCRENVERMREDERGLLTKFTEDSRHDTYRSLIAGVGFVLISLAMVMTLFGILLRDARRRQVVERQIFDTNAQLAATVHTLKKRAAEASVLMSAREEFQLCTASPQAHIAMVRYCKQLLPTANVALLIINNSRQLVEIASTSENETKILDGFPLDGCCGLRSGSPRKRQLGHSEVHCSHFLGTPPENYLCIPLAAHGDTLGVLFVECPTPESSANLETSSKGLEELAEMAAMSIAGLNLRARLEYQSIRDGLTSLFNRHFMEISLNRELCRAARNHSDLAVLMLDIDHFKQFNDTFGHEAGDAILREVAEIFMQTVRVEDIACRYGGEEFVIILPETPLDVALERAESIRARVREMRSRSHQTTLREVTVSIGVAMYPESGGTLEELLRAADRALYAAKHRGRNQIVLADTAVAV